MPWRRSWRRTFGSSMQPGIGASETIATFQPTSPRFKKRLPTLPGSPYAAAQRTVWQRVTRSSQSVPTCGTHGASTGSRPRRIVGGQSTSPTGVSATARRVYPQPLTVTVGGRPAIGTAGVQVACVPAPWGGTPREGMLLVLVNSVVDGRRPSAPDSPRAHPCNWSQI